MLYYLMEHADWLVTVIIVSAMVVFFVGVHYIVLRLMGNKNTENEIAAIVSKLIGIQYAVLLGFIAVSSWGDFDHAAQNAITEEYAVADLYRLSNYYPSDSKDQIQKEILHYAQLMIQEEWPAMQHGDANPEAHTVALRIAQYVYTMKPTSIYESNVQEESLSLIHNFLDARRARLSKNDEGLLGFLWLVLVIGATLMIGVTFPLVQTKRIHQLFMTGVLAALIGMLFSLILEFEYPFRGKLSVPNTGWVNLAESIQSNQLY